MSKAKKPPALSAEAIRQIGHAIGGTHWQADVARDIDYSKSMVTRVLNGTRHADTLFADGLRVMMLNKIEGIADLLDIDGLFEHPNTKEAKQMILKGIKLLRARVKAH